MGDLNAMIAMLVETKTCLGEMQKNLETLQAQFNGNFAGVNELRDDEIEFLRRSFFTEPASFPAEVRKCYEKKLVEETTAFDRHMTEFRKKKIEFDAAMTEVDGARISVQSKIKTTNATLDRREEKLKLRIADHEKEIAVFNKTIGELASGFGFLTNFFRMRSIQARKDNMLDQRASLVLEIEEIRNRWLREDSTSHADENDVRDRWNDVQTEAALATEKIKRLEVNRDELIRRAAFAAALSTLEGSEPFLSLPGAVTPPAVCPRCSSENHGNRFFCYYCGARFAADRPDVAGSLVEAGELNRVHGALLSGITQTVSLLAMVRGIARGLDEFIKSVQSVKSSQDTYAALPPLAIDVPQISSDFAGRLAELSGKITVSSYNLHPADLAGALAEYTTTVLTDKTIEQFFTAMGDELTRTTKEQWK